MTNAIKLCPKLPPVKYEPNPSFGSIFAPHVLRMELEAGKANNFSAEITPLQNEGFAPTTAVFHYGQSVFEGLKAYRHKDGSVAAFRANLHATRFRESLKRMSMADLPEEVFLHCLKTYIEFVKENVPDEPDHSLYLRPLMIAVDEKVKVAPSKKYIFYIMSSIAGNYFGSGAHVIKRARVLVNRQFIRAFPGGLGEVKTAANYAAGLAPQQVAIENGCDQVLFLDALTHDNIDELGGMNFFAVRGSELITPSLNGAILNGVTRRTILELAKSLGLSSIETQISFTELCKEIESKKVTEAFACGTAAVVSPIGEFLLQDRIGGPTKTISLPEAQPVATRLLKHISEVQRGEAAAPDNWYLKI